MPPEQLHLDEASSPATSPQRLHDLAKHPDEKVRRLVAKNPSISDATLASLIAVFPVEVMANPSLSLLLLANPNFFQQLDLDAACDLASNELLPAELAGYLAAHAEADVLVALGHNPATPMPIVQRLLASDNEMVVASVIGRTRPGPTLLRRALVSSCSFLRRAAAQHPDAPANLINLLKRAGGADDLLTSGPPRGAVSKEELLWLARGGCWARSLAALHPELPADELERLASDPCEDIRGSVARSPMAPVWMLFALAADPSSFVRRSLLQRSLLPPQVAEAFCYSNEVDIRCWLAGVAGISPAVIARLSIDMDAEVRKTVACRRDLSPDLAEPLSRDPNPEVRQLLMNNPCCPLSLLQRILWRDAAKQVCAAAPYVHAIGLRKE